MRIGTMFLGKVDSVGSESVQTKFFILGVPLLPVSSHYVVSEQVSGVRGFEIPLHGKSVLLGYVRIYAWLGALLCGVFAYIERHDSGSLWAMCVALGIIAVVTTFVVGGLPKEELFRRALLQRLTGVGAPPEFLPLGLREDTAKRLREAWESDNEGEDWERVAKSGKADPILYALAEYRGKRELARHLLDRLRKGDDPTDKGPYR